MLHLQMLALSRVLAGTFVDLLCVYSAATDAVLKYRYVKIQCVIFQHLESVICGMLTGNTGI